MKSTIRLTLSYMKSAIGKSLSDEFWDSRDRFDHILKIVWTKVIIWNKNMYGKEGKISAQPSSHTQFDSIFHTNHLTVVSGARYNRLLDACMKWSLDKRLQTVRTTVQTEGFSNSASNKVYLSEFLFSYHYWKNYIFFSIRKKNLKKILSHAPISMYNVNPEGQGGGGGGGGTGRSANVGQFF